MHIENGCVIEDTQKQLIVLLEVKATLDSIGSNFYEVKIDRNTKHDAASELVTTRNISNPIEYIQEVSKQTPLTLNSLMSYEELEVYHDYLVQVGIIKEKQEGIRQKYESKGFYSLRNSRYDTQDESIYARKVK